MTTKLKMNRIKQFIPLLPESPDTLHRQQEPLYHALGTTDNKRQLHLTFTVRSSTAGMLIRIISARDMHRKERAKYEQTQKNS